MLTQVSKLKVKLVNTVSASVTTDCGVSDAVYNDHCHHHHHHHLMSEYVKSVLRTAGYPQTAVT